MKQALVKLARRLASRFGYELRPKTSLQRSDTFDQIIHGHSLREYLSNVEGLISLGEAEMLYDLARKITDGCIVEAGSYRGKSTVALARGAIDGAQAPIYAIEPHAEFHGVGGMTFGPPDRGAFYKAMLDTGGYHVVRLVNLSSEQVAPTWQEPVQLLFLDGDHSYEGVKRDFDCWQPHLRDDATILFDDATVEDLGPRRFITELTAKGDYVECGLTGKIATVRRAEHANNSTT